MTIGIDPGSHYWAAVSNDGKLLAGVKLASQLKRAQVLSAVFTLVMAHPTATFIIEEPGRLIGRGVTLWEYVGVIKAAIEWAGGRFVVTSPSEAKKAATGKGNTLKPAIAAHAAAQGLLPATAEYWIAQGYTALQAKDMAETVGDAYAIANTPLRVKKVAA